MIKSWKTKQGKERIKCYTCKLDAEEFVKHPYKNGYTKKRHFCIPCLIGYRQIENNRKTIEKLNIEFSELQSEARTLAAELDLIPEDKDIQKCELLRRITDTMEEVFSEIKYETSQQEAMQHKWDVHIRAIDRLMKNKSK